MTTKRAVPRVRELLTAAKSYREYLKIYFDETELSYAEVARRAGFSSRSYPRDVTAGRRRLTVKSLPLLLKGLRLDSELAGVLQLLYFIEYPEEHPEALSRAEISDLLESQRCRALRSLRGPTRKKQKAPKIGSSDGSEVAKFAKGLTDVIAALGKMNVGVTIEDIHRRTGLPKASIGDKLEKLTAEGVLSYHADSRRYSPGAEHLDWTGEAGNSLAQAVFCSSVERLAQVAQLHFSSPETMLLNSAISISKSDLTQLKLELREVILKFVDRSVERGGDDETVVQIVAGMFEGRLAKPSLV